MEQELNPFLLQGYADKDNFCDRKEELKFLKQAMANQRNVSIISLRRLGKTALIRHLFATQRKFTTVFIDIYRTSDQKEMVLKIVEEAVKQVGKPSTSLLKRVSQAIRSLEFGLSFDPITGLPELAANVRAGKNETVALGELFSFLEKQDKPVVVAIDEFQQIAEYPEESTEALLREYVQKLRNVNFIFSGSNRRMMRAIFSDNRRPFYQATEPLYLGKINASDYELFIKGHFTKAKRRIPDELIQEGLSWCRCHTYFVQYLFNRLYSLGKREYSLQDLIETQKSILHERAPEYMTLIRLLSPNQGALLKALAKDGAVHTPTAIEFIIRHKLSAVSTVRQSLGVLLDKELVHLEEDMYHVTDVFLNHWLAE